MRIDLHCHSTYSDGTYTPTALVRMAAEARIGLFALTDHDTMEGVEEAMRAADGTEVLLLPSVELDCQSPFELHILGLDVNINNSALKSALHLLQERRQRRNARILDKLEGLRIDARAHLEQTAGNMTRLHIAKAICAAGHATNATEAFVNYLNPGAPAYCAEERFSPEEVIRLIQTANGVSVLAHPCHIQKNPHKVVLELAGYGLQGLEAYYPASTFGQTELYISLARQFGLLVTCGSDFHGRNREGTPLGCAWRDVPCLKDTAAFFEKRRNKAT